ncbi:MAG: FAD-binding oxidoreductase [Alicyclobacillus sp.]|nr:FAD-binding oxidoreductase [Alicyclobacillus sp.]
MSWSTDRIAGALESALGRAAVRVVLDSAAGGDSPAPVAWTEPFSEEEVAEVLRLAHAHRWTVQPRGAGTQLATGNLPQPVQVVLSLARLHRLVSYSPADLVVTVQAGMPLATLAAELARSGQMLPLDPPVNPAATVGGLAATSTAGPRRLLYGSWRDQTIALRVVCPGGSIVRTGAKVVKNVAGYDMTKLFLGSFGTLGVLTEITFKLRPLPPHRATCVLHGPAGAVAALRQRLAASPLIPSRLEALTPAADGTGGAWTLAVDCDEPQAAASRQTERLLQWASDFGLQALVHQGLAADAWWQAWQQRLLAAPLRARLAFPPAAGVAVGEWLRQDAALRGWDIHLSLGVGHGCGWLTLPAPGQTGAAEPASAAATAADSGEAGPAWLAGRTAELAEALRDWRETLRAQGGSLVLEAAPRALRRTIDSFGPVGSSWRLQQQIKQQFDPYAILNPGRFVGGM